MQDDRGIGGIDAHVDCLPDGWRQEGKPEIVAGDGQHDKDHQREDAEQLEGETGDPVKTRIAG